MWFIAVMHSTAKQAGSSACCEDDANCVVDSLDVFVWQQQQQQQSDRLIITALGVVKRLEIQALDDTV